MQPSLEVILPSLLVMGFEGSSLSNNPVKQWLSQHLGGVILFDVDCNHFLKTGSYQQKNILYPNQLQHLNRDIALTNPGTFIAADVEGGDEFIDPQTNLLKRKGVNRLKQKYGFPLTLSAQQMGELFQQGKVDEVWKNCRLIAKTLKDSGFNLVFAPAVDLNINPECPIVGKLERSFSERATVVMACAEIFIKACREQNIQCVLKHFPGHGSALNDTHLGFVDITANWSEKELQPYITLASQCPMIMLSHLIHTGFDNKPVSISRKWVQRLRRLGFSGVIITDDIQMNGLSDFIKSSHKDGSTEDEILHHTLLAALQAGTDMVIIGNQLKAFDPLRFGKCLAFLKKCISRGELEYTQLLASYHRVCAIKKELGLPYQQIEPVQQAEPEFVT